MKERPILFSAPMVRAILDGSKTQTRRLVDMTHVGFCGPGGAEGSSADDPTCWGWADEYGDWHLLGADGPGVITIPCPYGTPGDRLWVRETWAEPSSGRYVYRATVPMGNGVWRPSIHMKRSASRIALEIVAAGAERLLAIGEADAKAEGARPFFETFPNFHHDQRITTGERAADAPHRAGFAVLWDEINGDRALWISNPWVWVVTFKQVE